MLTTADEQSSIPNPASQQLPLIQIVSLAMSERHTTICNDLPGSAIQAGKQPISNLGCARALSIEHWITRGDTRANESVIKHNPNSYIETACNYDALTSKLRRMPSETANQPNAVPFEVFVQAAFEREFFRRQLLQCEIALRRSSQLTDSLKKCLEFCDSSVGISARSLDASLNAKHRAAISACTHTLVEFCDEIIRKSHSEELLQCTEAAISDASDQAHKRALSLAVASEARDLSRSIELESIKGELAASKEMVSVLRRRIDALEHLLEQERQQMDHRAIRHVEERVSTLFSQSESLHETMSLRIDSLSSQLKQVFRLQCCCRPVIARHDFSPE